MDQLLPTTTMFEHVVLNGDVATYWKVEVLKKSGLSYSFECYHPSSEEEKDQDPTCTLLFKNTQSHIIIIPITVTLLQMHQKRSESFCAG